MSRVEIYAEHPNGDVTRYGEVRGSYGGAMHIWMSLMDARGLLPAKGSMHRDLAVGRMLTGEPNAPDNPLGKLWRSLPEIAATNPRDGWVLGMTFDRVLVRKEYLHELAGHIRSFRDQYNDTVWATLYELADVLDRAADDPDVVAIGFNQTSVAECFWFVTLAEPEEDGNESRYYNTHTDEGHWYLSPETMRASEEVEA